ncbi:unnamed protein product [Prorocentrum cordatum]|uniref:Uncharacterized protein n=1 Tax=Prorocentrum cordatum TaxID=2364126 RepID=A0ABN9SWB1_9DINO|nr:unnamed protein product [Polarella glacialis]
MYSDGGCLLRRQGGYLEMSGEASSKQATKILLRACTSTNARAFALTEAAPTFTVRGAFCPLARGHTCAKGGTDERPAFEKRAARSAELTAPDGAISWGAHGLRREGDAKEINTRKVYLHTADMPGQGHPGPSHGFRAIAQASVGTASLGNEDVSRPWAAERPENQSVDRPWTSPPPSSDRESSSVCSLLGAFLDERPRRTERRRERR